MSVGTDINAEARIPESMPKPEIRMTKNSGSLIFASAFRIRISALIRGFGFRHFLPSQTVPAASYFFLR